MNMDYMCKSTQNKLMAHPTNTHRQGSHGHRTQEGWKVLFYVTADPKCHIGHQAQSSACSSQYPLQSASLTSPLTHCFNFEPLEGSESCLSVSLTADKVPTVLCLHDWQCRPSKRGIRIRELSSRQWLKAVQILSCCTGVYYLSQGTAWAQTEMGADAVVIHDSRGKGKTEHQPWDVQGKASPIPSAKLRAMLCCKTHT
jgi:hypothetical protein